MEGYYIYYYILYIYYTILYYTPLFLLFLLFPPIYLPFPIHLFPSILPLFSYSFPDNNPLSFILYLSVLPYGYLYSLLSLSSSSVSPSHLSFSHSSIFLPSQSFYSSIPLFLYSSSLPIFILYSSVLPYGYLCSPLFLFPSSSIPNPSQS